MTKKIKTKKGQQVFIDDGEDDEVFAPIDENISKCGTNDFFRVVETRRRTYTPTELWEKAQDYFKWVVDNPLYELKVFGVGSSKAVPKLRAMSENAFCLYAGITTDYFIKLKKGDRGMGEFVETAQAIAKVIYNQKFEGAASELLNGSIIARDLGLADKTINENVNYNTQPLTLDEVKEISKMLDQAIL